MIGVHTPELSSEHGIKNVTADARKRGLTFPIVVDDAEENWNAWGNSMWPAVYLVDKQGYVRFWWYGEMDWQGTEGHLTMRKRVQQLIAEDG